MQKEKPHGKKNNHATKGKTSRLKEKDSRQKEKPHGKKKKKILAAKRKTTRQKEKDPRQKEKPHGKKKKTRGTKKDSEQNFFDAERTFYLFLLP